MRAASNLCFGRLAFFCLILVFGTPNAVAAGMVPGDGPLDTTICELMHQHHRFNNNVVHVQGIVESDLIEHTVLVDKSCYDRGISLWIPHELDDDTSVRALRSSLQDHMKSSGIPSAGIDVIGRFSYKGKKYYLKVIKLQILSPAAS